LEDFPGIAVGDEAYDVFISYAIADWRHAADIDSVLRTRNLTSFFDRRNLPPGLPWVRELEKALNAAKAAVILIGPHGLGNTQQYERDLALYRQSRDPSFPIVPVILPETRIDRPFNFLQILTWIDFSHVSEVSNAPAELERLVAAVQGGRISPADAVREAICPYRGLDAFREEDSAFFFGRGSVDDPASQIGQLVRKVCEHPFVMVVGRSGTGKSSLAYAGLVPALRRARDTFWNVLTLRPGPEPLRALAAAFNPRADGQYAAEYEDKISSEADKLRSGDPDLLSHMIRGELDRSEGRPDRLLLYVDQWEELYAQAPSPGVEKDRAARHTADVNRFIDLLLNASQSAPVSVVATVRADFYDPLISHHKIQALLPAQQVLLGSMSRTDLENTIVEPAKLAGLTFDPPKLVSRILDEAGEDEGMLPLLQYALKETWRLREGNVMTGDSYTRLGGVREAIRLTAERTFDALSPDDQEAARKLFLRLVTPGEGQEDTRARAAMPDEPRLRKIVDQFAAPRTRLLVTGSDRAARPTVEVAHEALIRTWPRLREWVDANRDKLRARAAIVQAKAVWEEHGRREDLLLPRGFQLERARELAADPGYITIDDIKEFIDESEAADNKVEAQRRYRARRNRTWIQAAILLVGLTLITIALPPGIAIDMKEFISLSDHRNWTFDRNGTKVAAIVDTQDGQSVVRLWRLAPRPDATPVFSVPASSALLSPDGHHIVVVTDDKLFLLPTNGPTSQPIPIADLRISRKDGGETTQERLPDSMISFSNDSKWLIAPTNAGELIVFDTANAENRKTVGIFSIDEQGYDLVTVAASREQPEFLICDEKSVTIVRIEQRPMELSYPVKSERFGGCTYSAGEKLVAVQSDDRTLSLVPTTADASTGIVTVKFPGRSAPPSYEGERFRVSFVTDKAGSVVFGRAADGPVVATKQPFEGLASEIIHLAKNMPSRGFFLDVLWASENGRWFAGTTEDRSMFAWGIDFTSSGAPRELLKAGTWSGIPSFAALNRSDTALLSNGRGVLLYVDLSSPSPTPQMIGRLGGADYRLAPLADDSGWQAVSTAEVQLIDTTKTVTKSPAINDEIAITIRAADGSALWVATDRGLIRFWRVFKFWSFTIWPLEWPRILYGAETSMGATTSDGGRVPGGGGN
jgi:hypothetical protein